MALLFDSWLAELLVVLCGVVVAIYLRFSWFYSYWNRKGVPTPPASFPFGHCRGSILMQRQYIEDLDDVYRKLKGSPYIGFYKITDPGILICDPELIRQVLVKDFNNFVDREPYSSPDPLLDNLFTMKGERWRRLRHKLSPVFSAVKLKNMYQTLDVCGKELAAVLEGPASRGEVLEFREVCACYTTEIIATLALGLKLDSQRNPDCQFRQWARHLTHLIFPGYKAIAITVFAPWIYRLMRNEGRRWEVFEYFDNMVKENVQQRMARNESRKDFLDLFIQMHQKGFVSGDKVDDVDKWKLSENEVAAQAFLFYAAGFETSSSTMSYAIYEMAVNPEVQKKLHQEIDSALEENGGEVSYDVILGMKYLDKVVAETLRKYPPVASLTRVSLEPYRIPGSEVVIDKGATITVPVFSIHHDERYFPDPERFDPERFTEEAKAARHPFSYLAFGEGPRFCIGMRLGLLQTKLGLVYLLSRYSVQTCEQTSIPLSLDPHSPGVAARSGIKLRILKRE